MLSVWCLKQVKDGNLVENFEVSLLEICTWLLAVLVQAFNEFIFWICVLFALV
mgnify:FL=1